MLRRELGSQYSPLYFLASLGAGGTAVTIFMFLMFLTDHKTPIPTFDTLQPLLLGNDLLIAGLVGLAMAGIMFFFLLHLRLLFWNLREYRLFKKTEGYQKLRNSNQEVTLMALPLTLAMTINASFIIGAVFVPGLWSVVEYLFPFAIAAFLAVGVLALKIFTEYMTRLFKTGDFDFTQNNNLSQMLALFAFAMVGVGLAAPAAMSHTLAVNAGAMFFSMFFMGLAVLLAVVKFVLGFKSMLRHGLAEAAAPSIWIAIPILTLVGITLIRHHMALHHHFGAALDKPGLFVLTSAIMALELAVGYIGYKVLKSMGYFQKYIHGEGQHPGSYALICPGVAVVTFSWFFINMGLVGNGVVDKYSIAYFVLLAPVVYIQVKTIATMFRLNRKLLKAPAVTGAQALAS